MLQWAREQSCPWDFSVFAAAFRLGHFYILEWAKENGCPWSPHRHTTPELRQWGQAHGLE